MTLPTTTPVVRDDEGARLTRCELLAARLTKGVPLVDLEKLPVSMSTSGIIVF